MQPMTRVYLMDKNGEKFFGEGPYRLLLAVERTGSLRSAAASMNMAYTKALKLLKKAELATGNPLTTRVTGGKDGGGSCLTPHGKELLSRYETYRDRCAQCNREIYREIFFPER